MYIVFYKEIMKTLIKKKKLIILINKNEINTITTTLIKTIKKNLKMKYRFNSKIEEIAKIFIKTKKEFLRESISKIINNTRLFLILKK